MCLWRWWLRRRGSSTWALSRSRGSHELPGTPWKCIWNRAFHSHTHGWCWWIPSDWCLFNETMWTQFLSHCALCISRTLPSAWAPTRGTSVSQSMTWSCYEAYPSGGSHRSTWNSRFSGTPLFGMSEAMPRRWRRLFAPSFHRTGSLPHLSLASRSRPTPVIR